MLEVPFFKDEAKWELFLDSESAEEEIKDICESHPFTSHCHDGTKERRWTWCRVSPRHCPGQIIKTET